MTQTLVKDTSSCMWWKLLVYNTLQTGLKSVISLSFAGDNKYPCRKDFNSGVKGVSIGVCRTSCHKVQVYLLQNSIQYSCNAVGAKEGFFYWLPTLRKQH